MIRALSLNMVVHNEAHRIRQTLERALPLVDEVVIVDQSSTDGTQDILADMGIDFITEPCVGFAEPSRVTALAATKTEWVLSLDADEHCDDKFAADLRELDKHLQVRTRVGALIAGELMAKSPPLCKLFKARDFYYKPMLHTCALPKEVISQSMGLYLYPDIAIWDTKDWWESLVDMERYEALGRTDVKWLYLAREHGVTGEDLDKMTQEERHALGFVPLF